MNTPVVAPEGVTQEQAEAAWRKHLYFRPNALDLRAMLGLDGRSEDRPKCGKHGVYRTMNKNGVLTCPRCRAMKRNKPQL